MPSEMYKEAFSIWEIDIDDPLTIAIIRKCQDPRYYLRPRQICVLDHMLDGFTIPEMAKELGLCRQYLYNVRNDVFRRSHQILKQHEKIQLRKRREERERKHVR